MERTELYTEDCLFTFYLLSPGLGLLSLLWLPLHFTEQKLSGYRLTSGALGPGRHRPHDRRLPFRWIS